MNLMFPFDHDFQLLAAGGALSLLTTLVMILVVHLLFRLDKSPQDK